jgi:hypothetical protein
MDVSCGVGLWELIVDRLKEVRAGEDTYGRVKILKHRNG